MPEAGQYRSVMSDVDLAIQAFITLFACEEAVKAGLHKIALLDDRRLGAYRRNPPAIAEVPHPG